MRVNAAAARLVAVAALSTSVVVGLPQAASASTSMSITVTPEQGSYNGFTVVTSGTADVEYYLYLYSQDSHSACAATAQAEKDTPGVAYFAVHDVPAGNFSLNDESAISDGPGSYAVCGYLLPPSNPIDLTPTPAATATSNPLVIGACPPDPSFTITHVSIKTDRQEGFEGEGTLTLQTNEDADIHVTSTSGYDYDDFGSATNTHTAKFYDDGPGSVKAGDVRNYKVTMYRFNDAGSCYDASAGQVVDQSGVHSTQTLTVTYFVPGQGGTATVNGQTVPGSDPETPVPAAPAVTVTGTDRVGATEVCKATVPSGDSAGAFKWYVAGKLVATGASYDIPAGDYQKQLACVASGLNNANKAGPAGVSKPVTVLLGAPLKSTSPPAFDGETRVGGHIRVTKGYWSPKATTFKYQWYVGSKKIKGATENKYKIAAKYQGKRLTAVVSASAPGYAVGKASPDKPFKVS